MRTQLRFWMTAAIAVCAMATNGCSSSEKKADEAVYKFPDPAAYCAGVAKAICSDDFMAACVTDKDKCPVNMQATTCQGVDLGTYRPNAAEACVTAYETAYKDGQLTGDEQAAITTACTVVFGGTGGKGAVCTKLTDCDLDEKLECVKGKCEVPVAVAAGESCSADEQTCAKDYYCTGTDKICGKAPGDGAACSDAKPCQEAFLCMKASATASEGTCQAKIADGSSCTTDAECSSKLCLLISEGGGDGGAAVYHCGSKHVFSTFDPVCKKANGTAP